MDRPVITEKLIKRYEINSGKGQTIVSEYSPNLTKDEAEINQRIVKTILAKAFGKNGT